GAAPQAGARRAARGAVRAAPARGCARARGQGMKDLGGERECRGDLVARERRGELSSADRLALGVHLETCTSCRMTRDIRADFEAETAVELDDAVRIARLSSAARRWSQRHARPRWRGERGAGRWRRVALGLTALLMLAGSASATAW